MISLEYCLVFAMIIAHVRGMPQPEPKISHEKSSPSSASTNSNEVSHQSVPSEGTSYARIRRSASPMRGSYDGSHRSAPSRYNGSHRSAPTRSSYRPAPFGYNRSHSSGPISWGARGISNVRVSRSASPIRGSYDGSHRSAPSRYNGSHRSAPTRSSYRSASTRYGGSHRSAPIRWGALANRNRGTQGSGVITFG